ncbi:nuclear receptor subfamily 5, group A, member 5 isoform X1 [Takifugu flavidus]|uniref:nuclear receptor subfamily 5, group A, member 5 isoform X1 n=1 Tax=Takifugu flavidus TaxID=433684 RepID=UPI002544AE71|nr:nuclear receptor subfamily 5, group A, member 5 isoform X1 [Takifugu flavidus]
MDLPGSHLQELQPDLHHVDDQTEDMLAVEQSSQELKAEVDGTTESEESCPVCGDRVSGYHYGLLTCESCKGFFKRSVQNNKDYTCAEQQSCPMNLSQRKRCPFCRFQKCLAVGMKREAVRADRMRGGRNKFGPLYRRERQMKQQKVFYHTNADPHRMKAEMTQIQRPTPPNDLHLMSGHTSSDAARQPGYASGTSQSAVPMPLDCTANSDVFTSPSLPYPGLYHHTLPGYLQDKGELPYSYSMAATMYPLHQPPNSSYAYRSTAPSSSTSSPSSALSSSAPVPKTSSQSPDACPPSTAVHNFLSQLMEGEQDESQLCAKVVASLQREQANRGKHDRLNTFSIMCKMADQTLFGLVEWARNSALFKELKVEDQMVLLQSCWSELLVLDHLCRQVIYSKEGCIYLVSGQQNLCLIVMQIEVSNILSQAGATLSGLVSRTQDLVSKLKALQLDRQEFVCLKYLVLFNPDVKSVQSRRQVEQTQERVNRALMEHTQQRHPRQSDKFGQLLLRLPEVRSISLQVEEYLYQRHLLGDLPCNSLLTEMLHTKHS